MIITDEKLDAFMVCWADWCCQGGYGDARGYPRSAAFTHEKIDMGFGSTLLVGDTSDLEEIERYVNIISVNDSVVAEALRAHYEAGPPWQNLKVEKKCRKLHISERTFRNRVTSGKTSLKSLMQAHNFHSRMLG